MVNFLNQRVGVFMEEAVSNNAPNMSTIGTIDT